MAFRMRSASSITAEPAALSVAPVPACQPSKCPPSITTSEASFGSLPGISPTTLKAFRSSVWKLFWTSTSRLTGTFFSSVRTMRL